MSALLQRRALNIGAVSATFLVLAALILVFGQPAFGSYVIVVAGLVMLVVSRRNRPHEDRRISPRQVDPQDQGTLMTIANENPGGWLL